MTESQTQYATVPQWVKDIIVRHVNDANAIPQPADERINLVPRDIVNIKLTSRAIAAVRRACIREAVLRMRADGVLRANEQVAEWFGCGRTSVTTALRDEPVTPVAKETEAA